MPSFAFLKSTFYMQQDSSLWKVNLRLSRGPTRCHANEGNFLHSQPLCKGKKRQLPVWGEVSREWLSSLLFAAPSLYLKFPSSLFFMFVHKLKPYFKKQHLFFKETIYFGLILVLQRSCKDNRVHRDSSTILFFLL